MVNFVCFEGEYFAEAASDLVKQDHGFEGILPRESGVILACSNHYRVEVVVTEFTGVVSFDVRVIPEDCSVRVPFSYGGTVGCDGLFRMCPNL